MQNAERRNRAGQTTYLGLNDRVVVASSAPAG